MDFVARAGCPLRPNLRCIDSVNVAEWGDRAFGQGDGFVDTKTKKDTAVDFINLIRKMDPAALNALIVKEAGEDLAQFFLSYSANLISKDPARILENTSSLMLMGYLIRSHEQRTGTPLMPVLQSLAQA
jgi:hypothetical protein